MKTPDVLENEKRRLDKRMRWRGLDISIENQAGSTRHWTDGTTSGWNPMWADYGYIRRTTDHDGEHLDVFVGPFPDAAARVWVVRQRKHPAFTQFDENKVLIGFDGESLARDTYLAHYSDPRFLGELYPVDADVFAAFVRDHGRCPTQAEAESAVPLAKAVRAGDDAADPLDDGIDYDAAMPEENLLVTMVMADGTVIRSVAEAQAWAQAKVAARN